MKIEQVLWTPGNNWEIIYDQNLSDSAQIVLAFGSAHLLQDKTLYSELSSLYPNAEIISCSSSGNITQGELLDDSIMVNAFQFSNTLLKTAEVKLNVNQTQQSISELFNKVSGNGLSHIMLFADGLAINGTELHNAIQELPDGVKVIGGLSSDGTTSNNALTGLNNTPKKGNAVAVGLYGDSLKISTAIGLGWNSFGIKRTVTKSNKNIIHEIGGSSALELYKSYLGDLAEDLPSSALLLPVGILDEKTFDITITSVIDIDERNNALVFGSEIAEGSTIYFMKSTNRMLTEKAYNAALTSKNMHGNHTPDFAMITSSLGRKMFMQQWTEDETEVINDEFEGRIPISGFYGLGEIAPHRNNQKGSLHSHSICVSLFSEV